jgi:hypothetical protein
MPESSSIIETVGAANPLNADNPRSERVVSRELAIYEAC